VQALGVLTCREVLQGLEGDPRKVGEVEELTGPAESGQKSGSTAPRPADQTPGMRGGGARQAHHEGRVG